MSNHVPPYGLQPARLFCPSDSQGKNTALCCHALLQGIFLIEPMSVNSTCTGRYVFYHFLRVYKYPVSSYSLSMEFSSHQWFLPAKIIHVIFAKWWFPIILTVFIDLNTAGRKIVSSSPSVLLFNYLYHYGLRDSYFSQWESITIIMLLLKCSKFGLWELLQVGSIY